MRAGEVAVAPVAARAHTGRGTRERAREERQRLGVELEPDTAPLRHLVCMAEQPEAGHVSDGVRRERPQRVRGITAEHRHRDGRRSKPPLVPPPLAGGVQEHPGPERLREEERVARPGAALRPEALRMHRAHDRKTVLRLLVAEGMAAREDSPGPPRTCSSAAPKIAASVSLGRLSGKAAIESASSGSPPIAKTSLSAFVAAIRP